MLEAECRAVDCYMYLYLATAHLTHFGTVTFAERCFRKAVALADSESDFLRLQEFFQTFAPEMAERCKQTLLALEQRIRAAEPRQIEEGEKSKNIGSNGVADK